VRAREEVGEEVLGEFGGQVGREQPQVARLEVELGATSGQAGGGGGRPRGTKRSIYVPTYVYNVENPPPDTQGKSCIYVPSMRIIIIISEARIRMII
jgi:hypothetical protein